MFTKTLTERTEDDEGKEEPSSAFLSLPPAFSLPSRRLPLNVQCYMNGLACYCR